MSEKETASEKVRQDLKDLEDKLVLYSQQQEETSQSIQAIDTAIQSIKDHLQDGKR
jgi:chromosome segregation ATPase